MEIDNNKNRIREKLAGNTKSHKRDECIYKQVILIIVSPELYMCNIRVCIRTSNR